MPSLSARRAWIEIVDTGELVKQFDGSLSARRAWIEINTLMHAILLRAVALRKESVDRNSCYLDNIEINEAVALRKESVDRNPVAVGSLITLGGSLSARRAWIEMIITICIASKKYVALRKESVDRNLLMFWPFRHCRKSLSARRAWIEMRAV